MTLPRSQQRQQQLASNRGKVKARVMWGAHFMGGAPHSTPLILWPRAYNDDGERAYFVIPADPESYEQLVEQMARASYEDFAKRVNYRESWKTGLNRENYRSETRAALKSIGLTAPKKDRRK